MATATRTSREERAFIRKQRAALRPKDADVSPREEKNDLSHFSGQVGALIRERRKAKGWTREKLAERVTLLLTEVYGDEAKPLTRTALQSYENGNRPIPLNTLPYLAAALGCSPRLLLPSE